ncbi:CD40 ligand [Mantella aurantiaca]
MHNDSGVLNMSLAGSAGMSRTAHNLVAVFLGCILVQGSLYNSLVLLIFVKFEAVRTPINMILLNISVSDLLVCVFGTPFSFAASVSGGWIIGQQGCKWYGFCNSLFGIVSLISLSMLSYERYLTVLKCRKVDASNYRNAWLCIVGSWLYSLLWTVPPLFGWSSYGLESSGTTCSVVWHSRSQNNISYIVCLFLFCLVLPLLVMIFSYGHIVKVIRGIGRINVSSAQKREHHLLFMILCMITCYLFCWLPYGLISLMITFGKPGIISPTVGIIPSILAKSSTCVNPLIYIFMNKQIEEAMEYNEDYLFLRKIQKCLKKGNVDPTLLNCKEVISKFRSLISEVTQFDQPGESHEKLTDERENSVHAARIGEEPNTLNKVPVVAIHLVGDKVNSNKEGLQWQGKSYLSMKNGITYTSGKLRIETPGVYYVYSQVSFCVNTTKLQKAPFVQYVYLTRSHETDKLLLKGANTHVSSTANCALQSTQVGAVFTFQQNDLIFINVTDPTCVNYSPEYTFFGMFKLGDTS